MHKGIVHIGTKKRVHNLKLNTVTKKSLVRKFMAFLYETKREKKRKRKLIHNCSTKENLCFTGKLSSAINEVNLFDKNWVTNPESSTHYYHRKNSGCTMQS